jgi:hypothetical protein
MELQGQSLDVTLPPAMRPGRPLLLLAGGALLGFMFAVMNFPDVNVGGDMAWSVVARVNGTELESAEYQRALQLFASEKRYAITDGDRSLILARMVEEELLLQYGVKAGLVRTSSAVRSEVLQSVVAGLTMELEARADGASDPTRRSEDALAQYLGQLRDAATLRWAVSGRQP